MSVLMCGRRVLRLSVLVLLVGVKGFALCELHVLGWGLE